MYVEKIKDTRIMQVILGSGEDVHPFLQDYAWI